MGRKNGYQMGNTRSSGTLEVVGGLVFGFRIQKTRNPGTGPEH